MCGIFGIVGNLPGNPDSLVTSALSYMPHRGPDGTNIWCGPNIAFGHNLLSITGDIVRQPLAMENILLIANGELYSENKEILTKNLTGSDSENIIHLYNRYGIGDEFFDQLNGELAFALYDKKKQKCFLVRDRFGIKPLYYRQNNNVIEFSSEIKAFLHKDKLSLDRETLFSVFTAQYHDDSSTPFAGIKQVPAGSYLEIDVSNIPLIRQNRKWHYPVSRPQYKGDFNTASEELFSLLDQSVARRLQTTRKIGITLSGGMDSSAIAALIHQHIPGQLNLYSVSFTKGGLYDEQILARKMATSLQSNLNLVSVTENDLIDYLETAFWHGEGFSINNHLSAKYLLYKKMHADGIRVSFSGEGSDEIFYGYSHLRQEAGKSYGSNYLNNMFASTKLNVRTAGYIPSFMQAKFAIGNNIRTNLINEDFQKSINPHSILRKLVQKHDPGHEFTNLQRSSWIWTKICLGNYILSTLGDKMEFASSVEGRVPFLDKDLISFAYNLPDEIKIRGNLDKTLLRHAMKDHVIPAIAKKEKHPFVSPPLSHWNEGKGHELIMDLLDNNYMKTIFNRQKVESYIQQQPDQSMNSAIMLMLSTWFLHKGFCL